MSNIRVALFSGFGSCDVPKRFHNKLVGLEIDSVPYRIKLAEILDDLPLNCKNREEFEKKYKDLDSGKNGIFYVKYIDKDHEYIFVKDKSMTYPTEISIKDVDTSKPWRITEYDGAESLEIYAGIKVIDEQYNMCEW